MRRALLIVLLAGGCGGASSVVEDVRPELGRTVVVAPEAPDRWFGPVEGLRPGQWVRYAEGGVETTYTVAAAEGDALWIEVSAGGAASRRLVGPDGDVRQAWYAEAGKPPVAQALVQAEAAPAPRGTELSSERSTEKLQIGDRELAGVRLKVVREDLEGRRTEEESWWSPEVPPIRAGSPLGGLVRRKGLILRGFGNVKK